MEWRPIEYYDSYLETMGGKEVALIALINKGIYMFPVRVKVGVDSMSGGGRTKHTIAHNKQAGRNRSYEERRVSEEGE